MDEAFGMYGREGFRWRDLRERDHSEDLGTDMWKILK